MAELLQGLQDYVRDHKEIDEVLGFPEYVEMVRKLPGLAACAHKRIYDMIRSYGVKIDHETGEEQYLFFERELFGIEAPCREIMEYFKAAALGSDVSKRFLLIFGPPSSGKSCLVAMLKDAIEEWTKKGGGAVYAIDGCPMHEDPLHAIPHALRPKVEEDLKVKIEGELCPVCAHKLKTDLKGDFMAFKARRLYFSQQARVGVGTFVPSDPKCVVGDTLLASGDGLLTFDELQEKYQAGIDRFVPITSGIRVSSHDGSTELASKFYNGGEKPCVRVTTKMGFRVEGSTKHPILCALGANRDWKRLEHVHVGDFAVVQRGLNLWGDAEDLPGLGQRVDKGKNKDMVAIPTKMSSALARVLGFLVSEGSITDNAVWFTNSDSRLIDEFYQLSRLAFGIEPHIYGPRGGKSTTDVVLQSTDISRWLSGPMGMKRGSENKEIPLAIRRGTREHAVAFLESLSWGDGTIGSQGEKLSNRFSYVSVSNVLCRQLQVMLLNLGVVASFYEETVKYEGEDRPVYAVQVTGDSVLDLVSIMRGIEPKSIGGLVCETGRTNYDLMPPVGGLVSKILAAVKKRVGAYKYGSQYSAIFSKYSRYRSDDKDWSRRFTRQSLGNFLADVEPIAKQDWDSFRSLIAPLNDLYLRKDLLYLEVASIQDIGVCQVYDLMVPDSHSFCANGIVCHNSQDVAELIGSVDLSKIGKFGTESDPRAYKFDGELNVANRGLMEFIEILKVDQKFLYVLLTATQEKNIKTPRFPLISCDEVIVSHTNESEYKDFVGNPKNEALIDRMIVCRIPYNLRVNEEVRIYEKLLRSGSVNVHIAPHTLRVAAMFAILSRLEDAKDQGLDKVKKMKVYNKEEVEGISVTEVPRLMRECPNEGMDGISPRYVINRVITTAIRGGDEGRPSNTDDAIPIDGLTGKKYITPIDVLRALRDGFSTSSKFKTEERSRYEDLITLVTKEYSQIAMNEVQKAFYVSFEDEAKAMLENYLSNVASYLEKTKIQDPITKEDMEPNETLMRSIESKIGVSDSSKDTFRNEIIRKAAIYLRRKEEFRYDTHARLREAIEKQLFEDRKDMIRMTITSHTKRDPDELKRINQVIRTLCEKYAYIPESANDLLKYVSSIMMREKKSS